MARCWDASYSCPCGLAPVLTRPVPIWRPDRPETVEAHLPKRPSGKTFALPRAEERSLEAADRPQDEMSVRAKNSGHKKKTADKWNQ